MKRAILRSAVLAAVMLAVVACGKPSKQDILKKAENVTTRTELESALGQPDDISKLGPIEKWTYQASNGTVVFVLTGDSVSLGAAGGSEGPN